VVTSMPPMRGMKAARTPHSWPRGWNESGAGTVSG